MHSRTRNGIIARETAFAVEDGSPDDEVLPRPRGHKACFAAWEICGAEQNGDTWERIEENDALKKYRVERGFGGW